MALERQMPPDFPTEPYELSQQRVSVDLGESHPELVALRGILMAGGLF